MVLSDFLSRQQGDRSDPHQIIPISFNMKRNFEKELPKHCKTHIYGTNQITNQVKKV